MDWGWSEMLWVALISICLVFVVLVLLVWIMKLFGFVFVRRKEAESAGKRIVPGQIHEEEIAAVATALRLYKGELHDQAPEMMQQLSNKSTY